MSLAAARWLGLGLLCLGCSAHPVLDGGLDAGIDAGSDAGFDAGRDAGFDAAFDAGIDAGSDAGPYDGGPDDPGWVRLPGLPDECPILRATYPERVFSVEWLPCVDREGATVAGCEYSDNDGIVRAWRDDTGTWVKLVGGNALSVTGRLVGLATAEGRVLAAWREPMWIDGDGMNCNVTAVAAGGGRAGFVAQFTNWLNPRLSGTWMYAASAESIGATEDPVHVFPVGFVERNQSIPNMWISESLLAIQMSPSGTLYTYREGEWDTLTGRDTVQGLPQGVQLIGDHLLWEAWRGFQDVRAVSARWGEASAVWRDITPGVIKGFGTDGVDMGWFEGFDVQPDGLYARVSLWTAPYRRDLENVEPRMVRTVDQRSNRPAVGGGWLALRRLDRDRPDLQWVEVFSLRDGTRRTFIPPQGYILDEPYYATPTEIMFAGPGTTAIRFDPSILPVDVEP